MSHAQGAHEYFGKANSRAQRSLSKVRKGLGAATDRLSAERLEVLLSPPEAPMTPDASAKAYIRTLEAKIAELELAIRRQGDRNAKLRRKLGMPDRPSRRADDYRERGLF